MDDKLKHLESILDETVFKEGAFTEKNKRFVRERMEKRHSSAPTNIFNRFRFRQLIPSVLSVAVCFLLIVGTFYIVNHQGSQNISSEQNSSTNASNNTENNQTTPSKDTVDTRDPSNENPVDDSGKESPPTDDIRMGSITAIRLIDPSSGWVGGNGWIAKTNSGGKDWDIQYQGEQTVDQLFALDKDNAWVVFADNSEKQDGRRLLNTTNGGKNWSPVGRLPNKGFLHFNSNEVGFVGNAYTTNGGKSWSTFDIPDNMKGNAYFHDLKNGWAVTQEGKQIIVMRTTNGGESWEKVMTRATVVDVRDAKIRSAGQNDAWIELVGGAGMSQVSYSVFHTGDGGNNWQTVINNSTAGAGPAPGLPMKSPEKAQTDITNNGSAPGQLYVVSPDVAFMGGYCAACDKSNSIGWTTDGGKTWQRSDQAFPGYKGAYIAFADAKSGWLITSDSQRPSVMYTTTTGGKTWEQVFTFDNPE
ncbi:hypothetical protein NC797_16460 [Aquibacillus sp. 3ASR75-11]|uniref:Photosynthesis system II assembly factor Ycf48/Hcf136-like domain-containing protein n=1 Tax=Terrihalobacillus insolitus TaxID=2950438 RepID=A0A9X3WZE4_9BACI|nr:hypothetical protein [Terrihalobacillus insolitus]MDC3415097.1 hypothetical protein [Terrihalobacillus insolitus]MDC3426094.1 hypothetical protein [Terrihalobacillus insolitus]